MRYSNKKFNMKIYKKFRTMLANYRYVQISTKICLDDLRNVEIYLAQFDMLQDIAGFIRYLNVLQIV